MLSDTRAALQAAACSLVAPAVAQQSVDASTVCVSKIAMLEQQTAVRGNGMRLACRPQLTSRTALLSEGESWNSTAWTTTVYLTTPVKR